MTTLILLKNIFRLQDNPLILEAIKNQDQVIFATVICKNSKYKEYENGAASNWFLGNLLINYRQDLSNINHELLVYVTDDYLSKVKDIVNQYQITRILTDKGFDPLSRALDNDLKSLSIPVNEIVANFITDVSQVKAKTTGKPYKVLSPFLNAYMYDFINCEPCKYNLGDLKSVNISNDSLSDDGIKDSLLPKINWDKEFYDYWVCSEKAAHERFEYFIENIYKNYANTRNVPGQDGSSRLSPYIRWGVIGPKTILNRLMAERNKDPFLFNPHLQSYITELGFRELAYHLVWHYPQIVNYGLNKTISDNAWQDTNEEFIQAWQKGNTGFPMVDAGMRELWRTGFMHNRVRMLVCSFLTKHLWQHWKIGEQWFWDTLVDADPAINPVRWAWNSGVGIDTKPFYRIMSAERQGTEWDTEGAYVKKWVPELSVIPNKYIHRPENIPEKVLVKLNFELGRDYPEPVIDHETGRERALQNFKSLNL